jgi:chromosome segregation ATPase
LQDELGRSQLLAAEIKEKLTRTQLLLEATESVDMKVMFEEEVEEARQQVVRIRRESEEREKQLMEQIRTLEDKYRVQQEQMESLTQHAKKLEARLLKQSQKEKKLLEKTKKTSDQTNSCIESLESQLKERDEEIKKYISTYTFPNEQLMQENQQLRARVQTVEQLVEEQKRQLVELSIHNHVESSDAHLDSASRREITFRDRDKITNQALQIDKLTLIRQNLETENRALKMQVDKLEKSLFTHNDSKTTPIHNDRMTIEQLESEKEELTQQCNSLNELVESLKGRKDIRQQLVNVTRQLNARLSQDMDLERAMNSLQSQLAISREQQEHERATSIQVEARLKEMNHLEEIQRDEIESMKEQLSVKDDELNETQREATKYRDLYQEQVELAHGVNLQIQNQRERHTEQMYHERQTHLELVRKLKEEQIIQGNDDTYKELIHLMSTLLEKLEKTKFDTWSTAAQEIKLWMIPVLRQSQQFIVKFTREEIRNKMLDWENSIITERVKNLEQHLDKVENEKTLSNHMLSSIEARLREQMDHDTHNLKAQHVLLQHQVKLLSTQLQDTNKELLALERSLYQAQSENATLTLNVQTLQVEMQKALKKVEKRAMERVKKWQDELQTELDDEILRRFDEEDSDVADLARELVALKLVQNDLMHHLSIAKARITMLKGTAIVQASPKPDSTDKLPLYECNAKLHSLQSELLRLQNQLQIERQIRNAPPSAQPYIEKVSRGTMTEADLEERRKKQQQEVEAQQLQLQQRIQREINQTLEKEINAVTSQQHTQMERVQSQFEQEKTAYTSQIKELEDRLNKIRNQQEQRITQEQEQQKRLDNAEKVKNEQDRKELASLRSNLQKLDNELNLSRADAESLRREITELNKRLKDRENELKLADQRRKDVIEEGKSIQTQLKNMINESQEQLLTRIQEMSKELETCRTKLKDRERELMTVSETLRSERSQMSDQLEELRRKIRERESEIEQIVAANEENLGKTRQALSQEQTNSQRLMAALTALRQKNDAIRVRIEEIPILKSKIEKLERESERLTIGLKKIRDSKQRIASEFDQYKEDKEKRLLELTNKAQQGDATKEALIKELELSKETVDQLHADLNQVSNDFEQYRSAQEELILQQYQGPMAQLQSKFHSMRDRIQSLGNERDSLVEQLDDHRRLFSESQDNVANLQKNLNELQKTYKQEKHALKTQLTESTQKCLQGNEDWNKLVQTAATLKKALKASQDEIGRKVNMLSQMKTERDADLERIKTMEQEFSQLRNQEEKYKQAKTASQRKDQITQELRTKINSLETEVTQLKESSAAASTQYKNKLHNLRFEIQSQVNAQFQQQFKSFEETNVQLRRELGELEQRLESKEQIIKRLRLTKTDLEREVNTVRSDVTSLQQSMIKKDAMIRREKKSGGSSAAGAVSGGAQFLIDAERDISMTLLNLNRSEYEDLMKTLKT